MTPDNAPTPTGALSQLSDDLGRIHAQVDRAILTVRARCGAATGVAWQADGLLVTTASAIGRSKHAKVRTHDGRWHAATVLGRDAAHDLALLHIEAELQPLPQSPGEATLPGGLALVLGRPDRALRSVIGQVSHVGPEWQTRWGGAVDQRIEVDAPLPRGFDGGALVDTQGRLIGINSRRVVRAGTTLPWSTVQSVLARLEDGGDRPRPWLGLAVHASRSQSEAQQAVLVVVDVVPDGPAARAGLRLGDLLVQAAGAPMHDPVALQQTIGAAGVGGQLAVVVHRGDQERAVSIEVGARPTR